MHRLTFEGKIIVFETFLSLISKVSTKIISEPERIQKTFLWSSKPKMKNEILGSDFKHDDLKNVNIQKKSLQHSWVRRWYDYSFREPKVMPLKLFKNFFGSHFKFHSKSFIQYLLH